MLCTRRFTNLNIYNSYMHMYVVDVQLDKAHYPLGLTFFVFFLGWGGGGGEYDVLCELIL